MIENEIKRNQEYENKLNEEMIELNSNLISLQNETSMMGER